MKKSIHWEENFMMKNLWEKKAKRAVTRYITVANLAVDVFLYSIVYIIKRKKK
jgi:hypothetical protein